MDVFTDRGTTVEPAHPIAREERYEREDQEKARQGRICGSVVGAYRLFRLVRRHTPRVTSYLAEVGIGTSDGIRDAFSALRFIMATGRTSSSGWMSYMSDKENRRRTHALSTL
jgi:hypothetical protein